MQRSNTYIIIFSAVLTIILGGMLSLASVGLKPAQDKQIELDTKKKILGAVMDISNIKDPNEILSLYDQKVTSIVVDAEGNTVEADAKGNKIVAEKVSVQKNYRLDKSERLYPVYMFKNESGKTEAYVFPMFGAGLWDWISGYIALDGDLNTIRGIAFDHKQETPGLGARITSQEIQGRYVGKTIFEAGELVSVSMVKGEGNAGLTDHQVDGMSGATMTGKGVNRMLEEYLGCYQPFFDKVKSEGNLALN
ncbi:NADH:ubiquinone reductase (Na(+)-transporting) subunit C [Marinoscillum sp. MHG1-6]|uniref:NADH:ubiquinone reductase (Na(+)-transporting) subunit C n=1 Tax=Marinoscillum sp. MHG1-6 TaxID=2959627 RepID=UPI0021585257|nr:NADH:ubiquinone reductase (Na(+)-transporting) subunit C [Marinoscillum sp. MHG1-6]